MPKPGACSRKSLPFKDWSKELLVSWLFQTCFRLRAALDRRFLHFGVTFQEATALVRCVEAREIVPSRLALVLAKDKGKITRLIDRLEAARLVKRQANARDRRYSVIKPTPKGKRLAERITSTLDQIRKELFIGVLDRHIQWLSRALPRLHRNAVRIGSKRLVSSGRRIRRIGEKNDRLQMIGTVAVGEKSPAKAVSSTTTTSSKSSYGRQQKADQVVALVGGENNRLVLADAPLEHHRVDES